MSAPYYEDANVTLYNEDCRDRLWGTLPAKIDVLVTDPPYGIAYKTGWTGRSIAGDKDTELRDMVLGWWGDRPALVFGSWRRPHPPATHTLLIWDKGPASGMGDLSIPWKPSHEEVYVLGHGFVGRRDEGVLKGFGPGSDEAVRAKAHPNEKPLRLMRYLLGKCPPDWVVLDPFAGSGTTLRAAKDLGRQAIGIEVEERWCELAAARLGQNVLPFTAEKPT